MQNSHTHTQQNTQQTQSGKHALRHSRIKRFSCLTLFTVLFSLSLLLFTCPGVQAAERYFGDSAADPYYGDPYYRPYQNNTPITITVPDTSSKSDNKKTLPELEKELAAKKQDLHSLVTRNAAQDQLNTLYSALTLSDVQRETAAQRPEAVAETLSVMSIFSATGWIPLAVCAAAGLLLLTGVFRLIRRIVRGSMKEDFIK